MLNFTAAKLNWFTVSYLAESLHMIHSNHPMWDKTYLQNILTDSVFFNHCLILWKIKFYLKHNLHCFTNNANLHLRNQYSFYLSLLTYVSLSIFGEIYIYLHVNFSTRVDSIIFTSCKYGCTKFWPDIRLPFHYSAIQNITVCYTDKLWSMSACSHIFQNLKHSWSILKVLIKGPKEYEICC